MDILPANYHLDKNLTWEDFEVNNSFDDSYRRLNFKGFEYESDIFITYLPRGAALTVDLEVKRRAVLEVNTSGHSSYPDVRPGDGYFFTIYDGVGRTQLGTKPVRLVVAFEDYLVFRGYEVLAIGPFGLIDPGNTDYGVAVFLKNNTIRKVAFYRYDTHKCYEYAHISNRSDLPGLDLSNEGGLVHETNYFDVDFITVKRNADAFKISFSSMSMTEKYRRVYETDRVFNQGVPYWRNDDRKTAMKYFAEALRIYPINTDVIGLYGDYYEYSDYDTSMLFYELAISLGSTRKKDYYQLANFYKWSGDYDKADRCYTLWEIVKVRLGNFD